MRKAFIILLLFILGIGCSTRSNDRKYIYMQPDIRVTNAYDIRLVNENDSVLYSNMQIEVKMPYNTYTVSAPKLWPSNAAYASHKEGRMIPMEKITNIKVIPLFDYNANYPKGKDISDSCAFIEGKSSNSKKNIISRFNTGSDDYYYTANILSSMNIVIKTSPAGKQTQQFAFVIETSNQSSYSDTTVVFTLKP
ncbi:MAG: hypothetical protein JST82_07690 [Bacteroidetes bacterium]|nr:hypothetical protein [Bacteroidota bacterium]